MHGISLGKDGSCLNDLLEAVWPFHEKPFYARKGKISIVFLRPPQPAAGI